MSSTIDNSFDYDAYYEMEYENEYVYNEHDKDSHYEDDNGEYVLERKTKKKEPNSENNKPAHIRSDAGIYDELDYELSPRSELARMDKTVVKDIEVKDLWCKQHKIIIITFIVVSLVTGVIVGSVFATQGKFLIVLQSFSLYSI